MLILSLKVPCKESMHPIDKGNIRLQNNWKLSTSIDKKTVFKCFSEYSFKIFCVLEKGEIPNLVLKSSEEVFGKNFEQIIEK